MTLRQLISTYGHRFIVPAYQRRYIWGQQRLGERDAAAFMMECLIKAFTADRAYFLQGITLCRGNDAEAPQLVDGQQRLTFLALLLAYLDPASIRINIDYACRPAAKEYFQCLALGKACDISAKSSQDIFYFTKTLHTIDCAIKQSGIDKSAFLEYLLDKITFLAITIDDETEALSAFKMMNGTKTQMHAADIVKADIMRLASDDDQPFAPTWKIEAMRAAYAAEWEEWMQWWSSNDARIFFERAFKAGNSPISSHPLELLLRLAMRDSHEAMSAETSYEEFRQYIASQDIEPYHAAKHFFLKMRLIQRRIEEAFDNAPVYNRLLAILLLQSESNKYLLLHRYFVSKSIDAELLLKCYKLSFLGMSLADILAGCPADAAFDETLANLSLADVYHTDAKRDAFNLLLRLNIDEDIKLGRRFDFSVWSNRSLEHIYSKSKVWHIGEDGRAYDGNDNPIRMPFSKLKQDQSYMKRDTIANYDGMPLSEHCIGNLVLLYGENNAAFGNATFEQKKMMFLAPGDLGAFQSRNLLHSVCVFAGNDWDNMSIVDNYNLTLKNLKLYYGFK